MSTAYHSSSGETGEPTTAPVSLDENPAVDGELLRDLARINAKLAAFGLQPSYGYDLAPALGGDLIKSPLPTPTSSPNVTYGSGNIIPQLAP